MVADAVRFGYTQLQSTSLPQCTGKTQNKCVNFNNTNSSDCKKMNTKKKIVWLLSEAEKSNLRKNKVKTADLLDFAVDELEVLLDTTPERAKEIHALAEFQIVL